MPNASNAVLRRAFQAVVWAALVLLPWALPNSYLRFVAALTLLYMALATSWAVMGGLTGYLSLGHSFFFGVGAYATALLADRLGVSPFATALLAGALVAVLAAAVGFIALRVRGPSFVIVTLSLVYIGGLTAQGLRGLTGGAAGLSLPPLVAPGLPAHLPFYYAFLVLFSVVFAVSWWIRRSQFGLALLAVREDEDKAEMLGIDTDAAKLVAFVVSAVFVGIGGGLYAYWRTFLDPVFVFGVVVSVNLILTSLLGGVRTLWGPALGTALFLPGSYWMLTTFPHLHLLLTGLVLGAVVLFLPDGIIPSLRELGGRGRGEASIREEAAGADASLAEARG